MVRFNFLLFKLNKNTGNKFSRNRKQKLLYKFLSTRDIQGTIENEKLMFTIVV
jgi:hypothetical protein